MNQAMLHSGIDAPRASMPSRLRAWRWLLPFILCAAALRLLPNILPDPAKTMDEAGIAGPTTTSPPGQPGHSFPGSAYFYAEDAFPPTARQAAAVLPPAWRHSPHILPMDIGAAAPRYQFHTRSSQDRSRALSCLTNTIYYEAGNEPEEGQRAVAQVVLNRMRHPEWPNSICGVTYQGTERTDLGCQFTYSCDGSMARIPERQRWLRALRIAQEALSGAVFEPAGLATFYHTLAVRPGWSSRLTPVAIIGAHIFYRMPGSGSDPARFSDQYAGLETIAGPSVNAYMRPKPPGTPDLVMLAAAEAIATTGPASGPTANVVPLVAMAGTNLPQSGPKADQARGTLIEPSGALAPGRSRLPDSQIKLEYRTSGRVLD